MHAGAGMVHLLSPGETSRIPLEIVIRPTEVAELAAAVLADSSRAGAVVLGPGLGRDPQVADAVRSVVSQRSTPVVLDADGLAAVGGVEELAFLVSAQPSPIVITPHDGELARLLGEPVSIDRVAQLASLVEATGVTVLSKGPTTLVLSPSREQPAVLFVTAGTQALATAGTGDVLAGVIGALLAFGLAAPLAASLGAHLHGVAGARSPGILVSSALPSLIGDVLAEVQRGS
jgi:NAD(P)H-hydrate epimerase